MEKLTIGKGFIGWLVGKLLKKIIKTQLGIDMETMLNCVEVTTQDDRIKARLDVSIETSQEEFKKFLTKTGVV